MPRCGVCLVVWALISGCNGSQAGAKNNELASDTTTPDAVDVIGIDGEGTDTQQPKEVATSTPDSLSETTQSTFVPGAIPTLQTLDPLVVTSPGGIAVQPAIALDANLKSLLVFTGAPVDDPGLMIYGQRETGTAFALNEKDGQKRNEPAVCALANGGFVAVWSVDTAGTASPSLQIGFTLVSDTGPGAEQRVTTDQEGNHWLGHVACTADGGFVIAGVRPEANDPSFAAFARRYDANGKPAGAAITLNAIADATETQPVVAVTKNTTWTGWSALEGSSWIRRAFTGDALLTVAEKESGGVALAADYRVGGAALALNVAGPNLKVQWLPEEGAPSDPVSLAADGAPGRHTAAITLLERGDHAAMIYQTLEGAKSRMIVRYIGAKSSDPLAVATGKFPPYTPTISYRGGALVAAWTEPDPTHKFSIRMLRW